MGHSVHSMPSGLCHTLPKVDLVSLGRRLLQTSPVLRPTVNELLESQVVKNPLSMLEPFVQNEGPVVDTSDKLLSHFKVPLNMRNVNLPNPAYGKEAEIVKPLEQWMRVKCGAPVKKELPLVPSPAPQLIADRSSK